MEEMYCISCHGRGLDRHDKTCVRCNGTGFEPDSEPLAEDICGTDAEDERC